VVTSTCMMFLPVKLTDSLRIDPYAGSITETQDNINEVGRKARTTAVDMVTKPLSLIGFAGGSATNERSSLLQQSPTKR